MYFVKKHATGSGYNHALQVASSFPVLSQRWEVALLHDMLEDKYVTFFELERFLKSVGSLDALRFVCAVTRLEGERYFDYIRMLKKLGGVAMDVKIADLTVNLSRTKTLTESLKKRYTKALEILLEKENI